jgi:tetratricopeptide (TPR) repeat protein
VIQNIIQGAPPARAAFVPPEFEPPAAPFAPKPGRPARPAAKVVGPVIPPDPPRPPAGLAGRADADRVAEAGRRAFTDGQYGRALELFRRAAVLTPDEPSAHYLVSQAQFALGKYREAVVAIAAGMAVRPDWPQARFGSRELYWKKPELFDDHLAALRQAEAEFPDDANLVFLLGHQVWFDGKHDEARPLFRKAAALGKGQTPAEAFLAQ